MPNELVSTAEAAQILRRDESTISRWAASGRLKPTYRAPGIRGAYIFAREDVLLLALELLRAGEDVSAS